MYTDFYLKFADQAEADSILYTVTPSVETEEGAVSADALITPNYQNIDVLGVIYVYQPIPDPENPPTPIPEEGWHVNVRLVDGEDGDILVPFEVHPTVPRRIWA